MFLNHTPLTANINPIISIVLTLPNAYSYCLFTVTLPDMKSRSAHAFMCVMVVVVVYVCAWSGSFLLQSPDEMKLAFLL